MAEVLKLVIENVNTEATVAELSLLDDAALSLAAGIDNWLPAVPIANAAGENDPLVEQFTCTLRGASQDAMAATLHELASMQRVAGQYLADPLAIRRVWLHAKLRNETEERRALVMALEWAHVTAPLGDLANDNKAIVALRLMRAAYWERVTPIVADRSASLITLSGAVATVNMGTVVTSHEGDVPGRIGNLVLLNEDDVSRVWMGWRSEAEHPGLAHFVPLWEAELGNVTGNALGAFVAEATASDSTAGTAQAVICVSGTSPQYAVPNLWMNFDLDDISSYPEAQRGMYLWLMRAKVTHGTWSTYLAFGHEDMLNNGDYVQYQEVEITPAIYISGNPPSIGTAWDWYQMAVQGVPALNPRAGLAGTVDTRFRVQVWGYRVAGTANLYIDCLGLIPMDEGYMVATGYYRQDPLDFFSGARTVLAEAPDGQWAGGVYRTTSGTIQGVYSPVAIIQDRFRFPRAASTASQALLVAAWARGACSVLNDSYSLSGITVAPRYSSLRGTS